MKKTLIRILVLLLASGSSGLHAGDHAGEWYSAASFIAAYGELHDIDSVGTPQGPLNTDGRADEVVGFGLAIGYEGQTWPLRGELEYIWRYRTDMNFNQMLPAGRVNGFKSDARTQQLMANLYWDIRKDWLYSPYIGGGVGVVSHELDTSRSLDLTFPGGHISESSSDMSWALMAGFRRANFKHGKLQLGYRFSHLGEMRTGRYSDGAQFEAGEYISHEIVIGWQLTI